ncbi:hypothetical protein O181_118845 [Austropuccinia psidii MF-1]|uniref:Uncharacterized protein n=1 Tax=Austropuccinia psidii MF-1 TaxID=1389203 RepID=A0A9Q3KH53_9BASI|nr:hypothetical protein [Austropuccinia psidii MF-1]
MNLHTPSKMVSDRKPPGMACIEQFILTHKLSKELIQLRMEDREFNLEREIEPEREYSDSFRLARSGQPTKLASGFTPLRHQQTSGQELPYFPIPDNIEDRQRIIWQEQDSFQLEAEIVRPYDTEIVGPAERSTKNNKTL